MNIEFLAPAETELIDATAYYNLQSESLGFELSSHKEPQNHMEALSTNFYVGIWDYLSP